MVARREDAMLIDAHVSINGDDLKERIYLPSSDDGVDAKEYLDRYIDREFPEPEDKGSVVYSVPRVFQNNGEKQASLAEETVFCRLRHMAESESLDGLWVAFFHSAGYAGHSFRNQRMGKLMMREHDFVVFAKYRGKHFVALLEVKSTNDRSTTMICLEKTSDAKVIKNNKRSAQHQLRDHLEMLMGVLSKDRDVNIQCYIMWPFLGAYTKDPKQQNIRRWKEDSNLHVFEDTISGQEKFDQWFLENVLQEKDIDETNFITLLNRFIILSCGVFVNEINEGVMALLTQEQLQLLNSDACRRCKGKALVVHGAAGTGKTLLVLRKLQQLHQTGQLNEENRALYICYWPGIRYEMELKLEALGIRQYVDTVRFFISITGFLDKSVSKYKHIFMDETEAICLAFDRRIIDNTLRVIYECYHAGNCTKENCPDSTIASNEELPGKLAKHKTEKKWGELWFTVDINQASMFLPKHSPPMLKTPTIELTKVMRSTGFIFNLFKEFYTTPMPMLPKNILANMNLPTISIGHHLLGPPVYWADSKSGIDKTVANVIIDLCSTKGFKPIDLCVLPFLVNEKLIPESVNKYIDESFVENAYRPKAITDVETYLEHKDLNSFLIPWVLRVKGLEFKVVIMAIDDDDFDARDAEDRKKLYIMASRCTSMLILVSSETTRNDVDIHRVFKDYPFNLNLNIDLN